MYIYNTFHDSIKMKMLYFLLLVQEGIWMGSNKCDETDYSFLAIYESKNMSACTDRLKVDIAAGVIKYVIRDLLPHISVSLSELSLSLSLAWIPKFKKWQHMTSVGLMWGLILV